MYDSSKLDERDQYSVFFGGNHAMIDIQSTQTEKRRLLVFKDSYANCFLPLLAPYYREIVVIDPRYYTGKLSSVMSDKQFDDVLFLYNANTFFADTSLELALSDDSDASTTDSITDSNTADSSTVADNPDVQASESDQN